MKVLILGSEGFVGHNLVQGLKNKHEVSTADQLEHGHEKNYSKLNIVDYDNVVRVVKDADIVINLVADTLVSSLSAFTQNAQVNIVGLLNVLEACRKNNIKKIIFTSASSLVGEPLKFKVSENHPLTPKTAYGITKMTSEHYLRLYKEMYDMDYVIFRFFNIYGPYQKNGLIPSLYSRIITKQPVTIFGQGDQIRDYVYIEDVIPFFEKAISSTIANNMILNMGTGNGNTITEILKHMSTILNIEPKIDSKPPRVGEIGNFVADTTLLNSVFGMIPDTSIQEGLKKTIMWLQNN
jgi:UDP-glucose 4-epimerase